MGKIPTGRPRCCGSVILDLSSLRERRLRRSMSLDKVSGAATYRWPWREIAAVEGCRCVVQIAGIMAHFLTDSKHMSEQCEQRLTGKRSDKIFRKAVQVALHRCLLSV